MSIARHIYLIRHGHTRLNGDSRLRGREDIALDERGEAEADAVAAYLGHKSIEVVHTSPLIRAQQTASRIGNTAGMRTRVDGRLTDRDYGRWTGVPLREVVARFGDVNKAPGIESEASVRQRVFPALAEFAATGDICAVVTHAAVIHSVLSVIRPGSIRVPTGSWTDLVFSDSVWTVLDVGRLPTASSASLRTPSPDRDLVRSNQP